MKQKDDLPTYMFPTCLPPHEPVIRFLYDMNFHNGGHMTVYLELCSSCAEDLVDRLQQHITPDPVEFQRESEHR